MVMQGLVMFIVKQSRGPGFDRPGDHQSCFSFIELGLITEVQFVAQNRCTGITGWILLGIVDGHSGRLPGKLAADQGAGFIIGHPLLAGHLEGPGHTF